MPDDLRGIDTLKKKLYSPTVESESVTKVPLQDVVHKRPQVADGWVSPETPTPSVSSEYTVAAIVKGFAIASFVFLGIGLVLVAYVFWSGSNRISSENLEVVTTGPVSVAGGEQLAFTINVRNHNHVNLENTRIRVEYPAGTRDSTGLTLPREERSIDTIPSGESKNLSFQAVMFGEENINQNVNIHIEYTVPGSPTIYVKDTVYEVLLTKAPISLLIDYPKNANSGEEITFKISAVSNSRAPLKSIVLNVSYPNGFEVVSTTPVTEKGTTDAWNLGTFAVGEKKNITIKGVIRGQDDDDKIFRFTLGTPKETDERVVDTMFSSAIATIHLDRAFISSSLKWNGRTDKDGALITSLGSSLSGTLEFGNNVSHDLIDATVQIVPRGQFFDRFNIKPSSGFYKSEINTLYWDKYTYADLGTIPPGARRSVGFSIGTLPMQNNTLVRNPSMTVDIIINGKTLTEDGGLRDISVRSVAQVKFITSAQLSVRSLYATGPFKNTGPLPPRAEQKTTYTITLALSNTSNQISNGILTATLPIYVQWIGFSPSIERVAYNPNGRKITWEVGEVPAYAGVRGQPKSVAVQVELFPSINQIGLRPILMNGIRFEGVDRFTGDMIQLNSSDPDTTVADGSGGSVVQP